MRERWHFQDSKDTKFTEVTFQPEVCVWEAFTKAVQKKYGKKADPKKVLNHVLGIYALRNRVNIFSTPE